VDQPTYREAESSVWLEGTCAVATSDGMVDVTVVDMALP
jgi:hypothetical protein